MLNEAIRAIEKQQEKLDRYSSAWCVGEQLKDILRETPAAAELVIQDIAVTGMRLTDCEKKIKAFSDQHKHGNCGCCPPHEAERIIRKFYGIGELSTPKPLEKPAPEIFSLEDLL
ncbi:MAG: hypothetical protein ABF449_00650 [Ethanoligenens sp.]